MKQDTYESLVNYILENQDRFYRLAYSYAGNREDAMDIVQNAVCKALGNYGALREAGAMKTWFYRILVNESISLIKKYRLESPAGEDAHVESPYYEKGYETGEDLYDQINQLPEDAQKIIKLRFYEELSLKEIAQITGMNLNTVKAKLYRGLKLLKEELQEAE